MKLEIYETEVIKAKYCRKFNVAAISMIDLRGKWLVKGK